MDIASLLLEHAAVVDSCSIVSERRTFSARIMRWLSDTITLFYPRYHHVM